MTSSPPPTNARSPSRRSVARHVSDRHERERRRRGTVRQGQEELHRGLLQHWTGHRPDRPRRRHHLHRPRRLWRRERERFDGAPRRHRLRSADPGPVARTSPSAQQPGTLGRHRSGALCERAGPRIQAGIRGPRPSSRKGDDGTVHPAHTGSGPTPGASSSRSGATRTFRSWTESPHMLLVDGPEAVLRRLLETSSGLAPRCPRGRCLCPIPGPAQVERPPD